MRRFQSKHAGFTLIELAVVTAIIGLLVAGAVASFGAIRTNTKIKETHRALMSIELRLQAYVCRHGRLPCPASPALGPGDLGYGLQHNTGTEQYGVDSQGDGCHDDRQMEAGTPTNLYGGTLPALTLGERVAEYIDGWGNQIFYAVNGDAALRNAASETDWQSTTTFCLWQDESDINVVG